MSLPRQKISYKQKNKEWQKASMDHWEMVTYSTASNSRSSIKSKKINYDLVNGRFNKADLEYVCNPLGLADSEFPATLQHYDIISPAYNLLIGEEVKRGDNCIVVSNSPNDINRKQNQLRTQIFQSLQNKLMGEIDPSTIDPNNPPPTPEEIIRYSKHNISDMIEAQANKMLKFVKKEVNTKEVYKRGFSDVLVTGEEIYWAGVSNNRIIFRRCNTLNTTIILDEDSEYIDDAIAVTELRMLNIATILDEFGEDISNENLDKLETISNRYSTGYTNKLSNATFTVDKDMNVIDTGISGFSSPATTGGSSSDLIQVLRAEWKSFKKMYEVEYVDENGEEQEFMIDESFSIKAFKELFPEAKITEIWITEAWEGIKIDSDIYICVRPKENQFRRLDDPYYCKLGYLGKIYNSNNSVSTSLIERLKPYQYLYNILSYRLELAFASDQGKIFLMDLAQLPRSEGIDVDKWMYYLKAAKIGFINSFEEGRKGTATGKFSNFNQFQSIDLSLANQIQQYINSLEFIKAQVAFISGVSPQRLGAINTNELVGNVERSVQQSALITEYLFDSHNEVKRRCYTALVECCKIAFREGKKAQYVLDDMGIELLSIEPNMFDNSEFNVHITDNNKDREVLETVKQLAKDAISMDKANLSTIVDVLINSNTRDIMRNLQKGEQEKLQRDQQNQQEQIKVQQEQIKATKEIEQQRLELENRKLDLEQYISDSSNETKIQVAEINVYARQQELDMNNNGIPDPSEIAALSLKEREISSKAFMEQKKSEDDRTKHNKEMSIKEKEMKLKADIENKKIEAIKVQNKSQEKIAAEANKLKKEELKNKLEIEKKKLAAARIKNNKPKK